MGMEWNSFLGPVVLNLDTSIYRAAIVSSKRLNFCFSLKTARVATESSEMFSNKYMVIGETSKNFSFSY